MKKITFYCLTLLGILQVAQSIYFIVQGCDETLCTMWMIMGLLFVLLCVCIANENNNDNYAT